jgi:hypothetical protein
MAEINGTFYHNDWWPCKNSTHYTCQVQNQTVSEKNIVKVTGDHKPNRSNDDVIGVRFDDCELEFVPTGLTKIFKNMKILLIFNSKIKKLNKEDFAEYSQITQLWWSTSEIEYLPGNLLDLMPHLDIISFQSCKIKYIDSNFFDNHPNMKVAKFNSNTNIESWYDTVSGNTGAGKVSFEELKKIIREKCKPPKNYETYHKLPANFFSNLKFFLANEDTKDAIIYIDDDEIKLHKIVLQIRSKKLNEMIMNDEELRFDEFKVETFKQLIKYFYNDQLSEDWDMFELMKIAEKLELDEVKKFAMSYLDKVKVNEDNALKMIELGKEIGSKKLQDNAFTEIKKMLKEKELKDEWADDVEKLKSIFEAKQKMEEEIMLAKAKFDEMFL